MIVSADRTWFGILASLKIIAQISDRNVDLLHFVTFLLHSYYIFITFCYILLHYITFVTFRELNSVYDDVGLRLDVLLQYIRR